MIRMDAIAVVSYNIEGAPTIFTLGQVSPEGIESVFVLWIYIDLRVVEWSVTHVFMSTNLLPFSTTIFRLIERILFSFYNSINC